MALLHTMSLSGSIAVGIYLLFSFLTKRYLPIVWHKVYLTAAVFLFIVPLAYFKTEYTGLLNRYLGVEAWYQKKDVVKNLNGFSIYVYEDGIYASNLWIYMILLASVILGTGALTVFLKKYITLYRSMMKGAVQFDKGNLIVKELTKDRKRPVKSKVYLCMGMKTPVTIGMIHRKILIPNIKWEEDRLRDALRHELIHVYSMDNLVKMILILAVILNFYNPIMYYLWYKWNIITEMYCDYKVTKNKSLQETGNYAKLIIDFAELQGTAGLPIVGLSLSEKQLKERIENMINLKKTGKKYGKMSKVMGVFLIVAAVFVSSLTVYAYEEVQVQHFDTEPYEKVEDFIWYDNWEENGRTELDIKYDGYEKYVNADNVTFFISETGEVYYEKYTKSYHMYSSCNHTYISGTITKHVKDGKGGCKMDYYNGKRCNKCGYTVCGDFIRSLTYAVCPH